MADIHTAKEKPRQIMDNISTLEMEVAIMGNINIQQYIVIPNVCVFFRHEVDILVLSKSGYATEYEIKISKADIRADAKKLHKHESNLLKYLYFSVPDYLVDYALENIPERAGLVSVTKVKSVYPVAKGFWYEAGYRVKTIREAEKNKTCKKWSDGDIHHLLEIGVMRIRGLKTKILKLERIKNDIRFNYCPNCGANPSNPNAIFYADGSEVEIGDVIETNGNESAIITNPHQGSWEVSGDRGYSEPICNFENIKWDGNRMINVEKVEK